MTLNMMTPVLALICWTFVMWIWLYATRLPAMRAARIGARRIKRKDELDVLPISVKQVADNYNHLHEQPTLFYALAFYTHLVGVADPLNAKLAWSYVVLRIAHSLIQATFNFDSALLYSAIVMSASLSGAFFLVVSLAERAQSRRTQVSAAWRAARAMDEIVARSGGNGMRMDNPIQRFWRGPRKVQHDPKLAADAWRAFQPHLAAQ